MVIRRKVIRLCLFGICLFRRKATVLAVVWMLIWLKRSVSGPVQNVSLTKHSWHLFKSIEKIPRYVIYGFSTFVSPPRKLHFMCFFFLSVLTISLKRFLNRTKNQSPIVFPNIWKPFQISSGTSSKFSLQSHVINIGNTVDSGNVL